MNTIPHSHAPKSIQKPSHITGSFDIRWPYAFGHIPYIQKCILYEDFYLFTSALSWTSVWTFPDWLGLVSIDSVKSSVKLKNSSLKNK